MEIKCRFVRKKFERDGFCVMLYRAEESVENAAKGEIFTATGMYLPDEEKPGERITLDGAWKDGKFGIQFSVYKCHSEVLPTRTGMVAYLKANVKGMGDVTAGRLYERFGENLFSVIEKQPDALRPMLKPDVFDNLLIAYRRTKAERNLIMLLEPHGVPVSLARGLIKKMGPDALDTVKDEPYSLCNLRGVGFLTADSVARAVGYDLAAAPRIEEGLLYVLKDIQSRGHLFVQRERLLENTLNLLQDSENSLELDSSRIDVVLEHMIERGQVYRQRSKIGDLIYLMKTYKAEREVAKSVMRLLWSCESKPVDKLDRMIAGAEKKHSITYSEQQRKAIETTFRYNLHVITGYPGTGKTTVLKGILHVQRAIKNNSVIYFCSPTGRAARRMTEATGHEASTIHSLLGLHGDETPEEPPDIGKADLIVVDEVSMLDIFLADMLLYAIHAGTRVVLVGDPDQLPSVGPGAVLVELIHSKCVPVTKLDAVFRQADGSRIALNARTIRGGGTDLQSGNDFQFIPADNSEDAVTKIKSIYLRTMMAGVDVDEIEVLTPRRDKHVLSAETINDLLRERINPAAKDKMQIQIGKVIWRVGDKVMQLKNENGVSNGDIGYIEAILLGEKPQVIVMFPGSRKLAYSPENMRHLQLAYAMTVHKSQGSEFRIVILNLMNNHYRELLKRNLAYTAITRAKEQLIFIGQQGALIRAIKNPDTERRNTLLSARIRMYWHMLKKRQREKTA